MTARPITASRDAPREPINAGEFEALAQQVLSPAVFDFFAGGACDEVTLRLNRSAFEKILLRPRYLVDVGQRDLSTTLLGQPLSFPILVAPTGYQKMAHRDGELAVARAASGLGTTMLASTVTSHSLEEIAEASTQPPWFQLYCYEDRRVSEWLVRRAEVAGYRAICLTIDMPVLGWRERDLRNRFDLLSLEAPNLSIGSSVALPRGLAAAELLRCQSAHFDPRLTWRFVDWLRTVTALPVIIKGVLTPEDASLAVEHGASAIVVSNHGGRQLDGVPASVDVLEEIASEVGHRIEVLFDSGVRRGSDVLKALALGAKAVLVGRPILWGLAVGGEDGVRRVLELLRDELDLAMALVGACSVAELDSRFIHRG